VLQVGNSWHDEKKFIVTSNADPRATQKLVVAQLVKEIERVRVSS